MYGVLDLVKKCKEKGIKPIIGNEMYVINGSIDDPQPKKEKRYHLVVLAKNYTGYKNSYNQCNFLLIPPNDIFSLFWVEDHQ